MVKRLFLLDGMALVYRAHFALIARPIRTSRGMNTSAIYGFTQTLLEILAKQQPTHLAVAFDTEAPTPRHEAYPEYKATRQAMPEDLASALPHVRRMIEAFNIPVLIRDGFEADDIIGTLARQAEQAGFESFMVTPDKDFGQLVDEHTFLYKPSRMGEGVEVMGVPEIQKRWGIQRPEQVVDVLALMGDSSDNVPGVPGIGEKTAIKLIGQYGTVENLLARTADLKGRQKELLETHREQALLSKRLVTILCDVPGPSDLESLKLRPPDEPKLKSLLIEFEFNSIGRRLFGEDFKAGRGFQGNSFSINQGDNPPRPVGVMKDDASLLEEVSPEGREVLRRQPRASLQGGRGRRKPATAGPEEGPVSAHLRTLADVPHDYRTLTSLAAVAEWIQSVRMPGAIGFQTENSGTDAKEARLVGVAFAEQAHAGVYVPLPQNAAAASEILDQLRRVLESEEIEKTGQNLKFDLSVLRWHGVTVRGKLFDVTVAHSLIEPEMRHGLDYLSEALLGYTLGGPVGGPLEEQLNLGETASEKAGERAVERADVALQLRAPLENQLREKGQERVFYEVESPLVSILADMEHEGIRLDSSALAVFGGKLASEMESLERTIWRMAGREFNVNSPRQLGEVLFDDLKIADQPKKTRTGQYATDEQTLLALAPDHEIVQRLLEYRGAAKLKSTYADALPAAIWPKTGRVHTTYNQVMTATGRLSSQDPNLQNIPIRTERGQEIRKAFVPRSRDYLLLSADYSQIELRIIAALSHEPGLLEAFKAGLDVHTATAARVFGVSLEDVTPEMRRKAKMVNYGIAYGISAFGLAQRLGVPRREGGEIIDQYFKQFAGIRQYMDDTIAFARQHGYVETVTGRRRYLRDIRSSNNTVRGAAERNAINAPIQGTAADMIKLAMIHIHEALTRRGLRTRMLLQVHDELVFDLYRAEQEEVSSLVEEKMKTAIVLDVPIMVELGVGETWLEAH